MNDITEAKPRVSTLGFTNDQQQAYNELIEFINSPYDKNDTKRALIGAAGTGKTYLLKALIVNCNLSHSCIGLAAPTHKACRILAESIDNIVNVTTLQSDLGLRVNFDVDSFDINNPPFDPKGECKLNNYRIYIIDEASMIPSGLVQFLERYCKNYNCKVIYVGDESQLNPVKERYSAAFYGVKTHKLTQIVRQGDDNPISYLLELLRSDIKNKTFKFLDYIARNKVRYNSDTTKGYMVQNAYHFNKQICSTFNNKELETNIDYVKVIAYTNNCVNYWNKSIRNTIIENNGRAIITKNDLFISYTTIVNQFNECIIKNSEEYIIKDVVNYTHPIYNLQGYMVRFQAIHGGLVTPPLFVLNHSIQSNIGEYMNISNNLISVAKTANNRVKASKWKDYFKFKESCLLLTNIYRADGKVLYTRDIDYGFALTAHKSQGSTFDTVFVDVNNIVFDATGQVYSNIEEINRRLYVACSRAKNKLYLLYGN